MRVERLPFTVYDIVGYFVPGFLLLIGLAHLVPEVLPTFTKHVSLLVAASPESVGGTKAGTEFEHVTGSFARQAITITFVIAVAYALGHIISLLAGRIIEWLVIKKFFGYPSQYLIDNPNFKRRRYHPAALPKLAQKRLSERFEKEFGAKLSPDDTWEWFSLIDYYLRSHNPPIAARMYNYVVLCGFLRNTAFVFLLLGIVAFRYAVGCRPNVTWLIPGSFFILMAFSMAGFQKYFRRYSTEALMAFAVGEPDESEDDKINRINS